MEIKLTYLVFLFCFFFYCLPLLEPFGSRFIDVVVQLKILNVDKMAFKWL